MNGGPPANLREIFADDPVTEETFFDNQTPRRNPQPTMNEGEYYATEITDAEIDAQADSGECYLDESGFYFMPTREDIRLMMIEGERIYIEELERDMLKELYKSE